VRVYESQVRLPANTPVIAGLKPIELWNRGIADLTEGNGTTAAYVVLAMENGDKLFVRTSNVIQNVGGKITATSVGRITGGTGKLATIEGFLRYVLSFDPRPGGSPGESQYDIEYSIGK
jgi:hypothetical protein